MAIMIKNRKGESYYIHGNGKFFYCSKVKSGALEDIPEGYEVTFTKYGMPYLTRK